MIFNKAILSIFSFLLALSLTSCSSDKEKLSGKRESFITLHESLIIDKDLKSVAVIIDEATENNAWEMSGCNYQHNIKPVKIPSKLEQKWSANIGKGADTYHRIISSPVVCNKIIYTIDVNSKVQARSIEDGKLIWEVNLAPANNFDNAMSGGLCINDNKLYVTTSFGEVFCIDDKGKIEWKKHLLIPIRSVPVVYKDMLYLININNELIALNKNTGEEIWSHNSLIENNAILGAGAPAISDNIVVATFSSGEVSAFDCDSGRIMWSDTINSLLKTDSVSSISHIRARPVIDNGTVYIISNGGKFISYSLLDGEKKWILPIGALRTPLISNNFIFVLSTDDDLICLDKNTGKIKWISKLPNSAQGDEITSWSGPLLVNDKIVLTATNKQMLFIDVKNGNIDNKIELKSPCQISPIACNSKLFILDDNANLSAFF